MTPTLQNENAAWTSRTIIETSSRAPIISVLMPVRNGEQFLEQALESLAAQSLVDFEAIIVDNGSVDGTTELLRQWAARDGRLRVLRLERTQLAASLNRAASFAAAEFIARLDADDILLPHHLERQVALLHSHPEIGMLGSAVELIDWRGRRLDTYVKPGANNCQLEIITPSSNDSIFSSSIVMRAAIFREIGGYRNGLNVSEDIDLVRRFSERSEVARAPSVGAKYRIHRASVTARQSTRMALADMCVSAAIDARRQGLREPFVNGSPQLRQALPLLQLSRPAARRRIVLRSLANRLVRSLLTLPIPMVIKRFGARLSGFLLIRQRYHRWLLIADRRERSASK